MFDQYRVHISFNKQPRFRAEPQTDMGISKYEIKKMHL